MALPRDAAGVSEFLGLFQLGTAGLELLVVLCNLLEERRHVETLVLRPAQQLTFPRYWLSAAAATAFAAPAWNSSLSIRIARTSAS